MFLMHPSERLQHDLGFVACYVKNQDKNGCIVADEELFHTLTRHCWYMLTKKVIKPATRKER